MMKNILCSLLLLVSVGIPQFLHADMESYCSAPPYVTRSIAPNIMILMDNSEDMLEAAYPDQEYSPNATKDNYIGYFVPQGCYKYEGGKFKEESNSGGPYTDQDDCPATAPFRGNLMNWATMSKFDILQKVVVGGNTTSLQDNAHTLVSLTNVWPEDPETFTSTARYYNGCEFRMDNGNLTILDHPASGTGTCPLLDPVTAGGFALNGRQADTRQEMDLRALLSSYVERATGEARQMFASVHDVWEDIDLVSTAWAGPTCKDIQPGALDGKIGDRFWLTLTLPQKLNGSTATWNVISLPTWMDSETPALQTYDNKQTAGIATWSGIPDVPGFYPFEVEVTSDGCEGTSTISSFIVVGSYPPEITHYSTEAAGGGVEGVYIEYTLHGQGGVAPRTWSLLSGSLPPGLSLDASGLISGTPTSPGSYTFTVELEDSLHRTDSKELTITIAGGLTILTTELPGAQEGETYSTVLKAGGGNPGSGYVWEEVYSVSSNLPSGVTLNPDGRFSGTIAAGAGAGNPTDYAIRVRVTDADGVFEEADFTISVVENQGHVVINSGSTLPWTFRGDDYSYQIDATGGVFFQIDQDGGAYDEFAGGYKWWVTDPVNAPLPSWMSLDPYTGILSGIPDNTADITYPSFSISVEAGGHHVDSQTFKITSFLREPTSTKKRSQTFSVSIELIEEDLVDLNGNGSWDDGETFTDLNGDGVWNGKSGVFNSFWNSTDPKARWGMTRFRDVGASSVTSVDTCIPVSTAESFYTAMQNATAASSSPLASGLYGALHYYQFDGTGYSGCSNSDPIDHIPCRKNYVLILSSGDSIAGDSFPASGDCLGVSGPMAQNACYGFENDLRPLIDGKQNVYTYAIKTMGDPLPADDPTQNPLLDAAIKGGGNYYDATQGDDLEKQLTQAIEDILAQAASGTAVSVLTTSSRGIGSMMQAYFLPIRQEGAREVRWTGYVQNLWIDPDDNLREDSNQDFGLDTSDDKVLKLYFDETTSETKAALFDPQQLAGCSTTDIKEFDEVAYTWEGGLTLAERPPSERDLFTAGKVLHGTTTGTTTVQDLVAEQKDFDLPLYSALESALNPDTGVDDPFTAENIVRYIRGECLETGVTGDSACVSTADTDYRDRRVFIKDDQGNITGNANGNVWKLGDVISSTPKVLANTPQNTYHIDYGDLSYYRYFSGEGYKNRSSVSFVGANDGILHAFRVGYLVEDEDNSDTFLGFFQDIFSETDTTNDEIGEEIWGYIPYNALPYLRYLADPEYCHIYYNDLSVRLVDASLGDPDDLAFDGAAGLKHAASWRTILIGGMRFGGGCAGGTPTPPLANAGYSAYYAIDVTDAEHPVPLWEFSDEDLGYASGYPSIVRTGVSAVNGNWYVVFGSGSTTLPKSGVNSADIGRDSEGFIYILDLKTGERVAKIPLGHNAIVGDVLAIDKDKDYQSEKIYFGTSYQETDSEVWKGKLMSIDIPEETLTASSSFATKTLFAGNFPFTASPDATRDLTSNTWVYAGSGKYYSDNDEATYDDQIFLGIKDLSGGTYPVPLSDPDLVDKTDESTTGAVRETEQVCAYDPGNDEFGFQTVVVSTDSSTTQTTPDKGWYLTLSNGERVISRPLAVGGLVDFLTYKPSSDDCSYGGDSYLYAVGYTTGEAPSKVAIRNPETTSAVSGENITINKGIRLGPGAPPTGEAIIIPPPTGEDEQLAKKIQVATGVIVEAENTPAMSVVSKVIHWLKK